MENDELAGEIEALNATYGEHTLRAGAAQNVFVLALPNVDVKLNIVFPENYPQAPPSIISTESTGDSLPKGYGAHVLTLGRRILGAAFEPGQICLYELVEALSEEVNSEGFNHAAQDCVDGDANTERPVAAAEADNVRPLPKFFISETVSEKKSVFIAQACAVTSPTDARRFLNSLVASDRKLQKSTHNISAYRIRSDLPPSSTGPELTYQDCDDDGEDAAGGRLLHLLQMIDAWNVLVVVSRWYGGVKLGPDRFRIINQVARDALVVGGWVKDVENKKGGKKGK